GIASARNVAVCVPTSADSGPSCRRPSPRPTPRNWRSRPASRRRSPLPRQNLPGTRPMPRTAGPTRSHRRPCVVSATARRAWPHRSPICGAGSDWAADACGNTVGPTVPPNASCGVSYGDGSVPAARNTSFHALRARTPGSGRGQRPARERMTMGSLFADSLHLLVPLPVILPLFAAGVKLALGARRPKLQQAVSLITLTVVLIVGALLMVGSQRYGPQAVQIGGWGTPIG